MENNTQNNNLIEEFEELKEKANSLYPDLESTLETFNSSKVETENYFNYLNLINDNPLPTVSNHTT